VTPKPTVLLTALILAGCSLFGGVRTFGFSFPAEGNMQALPVLLTDHSGSVVEILGAPGFEPLIDEGIATIPEDPNAVVAHWIGGFCDASVAITVHETSGFLDIIVATTRRPGDCEAIGIQRAVLIKLSSRADMSRIGIKFEP
jgi:hypothetical protein